MKKTLLFFAVVLGFVSANAQDNPFAKYGYEPKIATLSQGKYHEFFDNDTLVQIGSVLFNTKSQQIVAFVEIDTLYSEATLEPDIVSRWLSPDPLANEYASWSPYNYVLNNPIIFIDPDGRKVVFAKGVSEDFKNDFAKSVQHLNKHGAGGMLAKLHASDVTYYIAEGNNRGTFNYKTKTITWDTDMGVITNEGQIMSPTSVLNHEVDHALQYDQNEEQYMKDRKTKDPDYKNKEEKRVITGSEQTTAKKLGEIKEGEVTRKDHGGSPYDTKGPTSTEGKNEVIIKAKPIKREEK